MLAIKDATVLTAVTPPIEAGTLLVEHGRIAAVGQTVSIPSGCETVCASGKYVMPGIIDAHTHLGIVEEGVGWEGNDLDERSAESFFPHLRAIDAINFADLGFTDALSAGITTVMVVPGSLNVCSGQTVIVKTAHPDLLHPTVVKEPAGLKIALGQNAKKENLQQRHFPNTRMGLAASLRAALIEGKNYVEGDRHETRQKRDLRAEILGRVVSRELPLHVHALRVDDIATAVRIVDEFGINLVVHHGTEAYKVARSLAAAKVPVVFGPIFWARAWVELRDANPRGAQLLVESGVKVALATDHPVVPIHLLRLCCSTLVADGLAPDLGLKMITVNPAEILGIADRVGSLEVGKDADFVVLSGSPFELTSKIEMVFVNGVLSWPAMNWELICGGV